MYTYRYPRPSVAVDIAIFRPHGRSFQILLIQRDKDPFQGFFALPGGFLELEESLEEAAARELREETGFDGLPLVQIHTFSAPDRDPRGRVVSTCFGTLLDQAPPAHIQPGDDARDAAWFDLDDLPALAFDHLVIIETAADKLLPAR